MDRTGIRVASRGAVVLAVVLAALLVLAACSDREPETAAPAVESTATASQELGALVEQGDIPETVLAAAVGSYEAAEGTRLLALSETQGLWWEGADVDIYELVQKWRAETPADTFYIVASERTVEGSTTQLIGVYSLTPSFDTVTHANAPYEQR
jgi:hypothetical protein